MGQDPASSGQEPQNQQSQQNQQPQTTPTGQEPTGAGTESELDRMKRELAATRQEAAGYRVKLKEYEQASMTELQRAQAQAKEAQDKLSAHEARVREMSLRIEIERAARKLGIVDEDAAARLIDSSAITLGADGKVSGVDAALDALVKSRPWLVSGTQAPNAGSVANPQRTATAFTREQLNDPVFYEKNRDAILAAYREGRIS